MEVSVVVVTTGWTMGPSAIILSIVGVVRVRWSAWWGLTAIAWIVRTGVLVSASMRVSSNARGILVLMIVIMVTWRVCSAIRVPMILSSVCTGNDGELFLNMNTRVLSEPILLLFLFIYQFEKLSIP